MSLPEQKNRLIILLSLHVLLLCYSLSGIFSKLASREEFLSIRFCLFYGAIISILFLYALFWQQMIKRLPLTLAYANKAVTVVWGILWGRLFFQEDVTRGKIIGAALIMAGIALYALSDSKAEEATPMQT